MQHLLKRSLILLCLSLSYLTAGAEEMMSPPPPPEGGTSRPEGFMRCDLIPGGYTYFGGWETLHFKCHYKHHSVWVTGHYFCSKVRHQGCHHWEWVPGHWLRR